MSIYSMYYIDCSCSQSCPEQREYGFIPEKFNFCSIFGVDFNIKIFCVNIVLREDSTANRRKSSIMKFNGSEITEINHIFHIFSGFPFFTIEICIFAVLCKSTGTRALNKERMKTSTELFKCVHGRQETTGK